MPSRADWYRLGRWVLGAEGKRELLPLIGEPASSPELGCLPTDVQRKDPDAGAAALLILDNVSHADQLSPAQLAGLPRADWLLVIDTTRLEARTRTPTG